MHRWTLVSLWIVCLGISLAASPDQTEFVLKKYSRGEPLTVAEKELITPLLQFREEQRRAVLPSSGRNSNRDTFVEDFEGPFPPAGWSVIDNDGGNSMNPTFTYFTAYSGSQGVQAMGCQDDYLITPPLLVLLPTDSLSFWLRTESTAYDNSFEILVSTTGTALDDFDIVLADFPHWSNNVWTHMSFPLTDYLRATIYIAFHVYYSESQVWDFGFDDISIPQIYLGPEPPAAAYGPSPADSATGVEITTPLQWYPGLGTQGSRLYFGTDDPPTNLVNGTDLGDTTVYWPDSLLAYSTTYYWQIIPYNEYGENTNTPVWQFTTREDPTLYPPVLEDFDAGYPPPNWTEAQGLLGDPTDFQPGITYSGWTQDGFANDGFIGSAKLNIYGSFRDEWMFTPPVYLGDGTDEYRLEFDLALTPWMQTGPAQLGWDDLFAVVISTDMGQTWSSSNVLRAWTDTTDISNTGDHIIIPLTGYSGYVMFGFYGESTVSNADNDLFVDNLQVRITPTTPIFTSDPDSVAFDSTTIGEFSDFIPVAFTNTGIDTLTITAVRLTGPDSSQFELSDVNTYPVSLTIDDMLELAVRFHPDTTGFLQAALEATDDQGRVVHTIPVTGMAYPDQLNPPGYVIANAGIQSATIFWGPPGTQMGDLFINAFPVDSIPFSASGSTIDYHDDIGPFSDPGVICDWYGSSYVGRGNDVVYEMTLSEEQTLTVSLCGSSYDCALGIYIAETMETAVANDDFCGLQSEITCTFPPGTYYVVVDGYSDFSNGDYVLNIYPPTDRSLPRELTPEEAESKWLADQRVAEPNSEQNQRAFLGYNLYRSYQAEPFDLILEGTDQLSYADTNLVPGDQYRYQVTALYTSGESAPAGPATVIPEAVPGPAVIIQYPLEGDTVYQNPVEVQFNVQYFNVGSPGTADGYINLVVDGQDSSTITVTGVVPLYGLSLGEHHVYMELVDNGGHPLTPPASDEVTFTRGNHAPADFSLLYAFTNNGNINITPNNLTTSRMFSWTESQDPDGTALTYSLYFISATDTLLLTTTTGNSTSLTNQAIYDSLRYHYWPAVSQCIWNVSASDGDTETWADDPYGIGSLTIDISAMGTEADPPLPETFALYPSYPNPFNPATTIRYDVPESGSVTLTVYDLQGRRVKTLAAGLREPGRYRVRWSGTGADGYPVASGMYLIRMEAAGFVSVQKVLLLK
ncbi:MAG: T9SS C-terminal target domain-containing protein [Candidatus Neomarinimicrobiota bacterium]|nr:MAG: T9SS C-terminal target domain-containing protein [Candidatus Neomarinimicrobiota bacterium]